MRALVTRMSLAAVLAGAGVVGLAPAATAASCTTGMTATGGWAICTGYPAYRAAVECFSNVSGLTFWVYGPLVGPGVRSRVDCPSPAFPILALAQLGGDVELTE